MPPKEKGKSAKGYARAESLPPGTEVEAGFGSSAKRWTLGAAVGTGGFGDIYSARESTSSSKEYPYVVKIEPHGNGPLFVEMHFYMRNAKKQDIDDFIKVNKLKSLGMPAYVASGSLEYKSNKYRFVVMDRFGKDLWHRFLENGRTLPIQTVFRIAIQMLDVYQYIHGRTYVHGDLKGANILFGMKKGTENQSYLVDFGLASHYTLKEYKREPKKAHDGTIEYTSRDAHNGVSTRRGDMEILGYNIVQWLAGSLPWETDLRHPATVQAQKEKHMSDIPNFLKKSFKSAPPSAVISYLQYVSKMEYDETPDYKTCKQMFEAGLKSLGFSLTCNLDFTPVRGGDKAKKSLLPIENESSDDEAQIVAKKKKMNKKDTGDRPAAIMKKVVKKRVTKAKKTSNTSSTSISDNTVDSTLDDTATSSRALRSAATSFKDVTSTSVDIFEDSCDTPPRQGTKRKHTKRFAVEYCTDEEVTVRTTVKKKGGVVKEETRSWKKCPAVVNGRTVNGAKN